MWWLLLFGVLLFLGINDEDDGEIEVGSEGTMDKKDLQKVLDEAVRMSKLALSKNGITNDDLTLTLAQTLVEQTLREYSIGELLFEEDE